MSSADAQSRALAAEQSARARIASVASEAKAAAAAMQAAVGVCQRAWSAHPVLAGDAVDPTAITALATACASAFGASSTPTITWVQTDMSRAATILSPNEEGRHGQDPVVLVLITGRFVGDTSDSTALLIIPSKTAGHLGIDFSIDAQTVADIGTLGAVRHG